VSTPRFPQLLTVADHDFAGSNVICSAIPGLSALHKKIYAFSSEVSEHLLPRTTAYHEIWLDKKLVAGEALKDAEPLYGEFYLPRKVGYVLAL
jgi:sulfite reductase (NADPH) hemoprotein beta-component